jgi:hypothetical protein
LHRSGDANLEQHLRGEIEKEKRKTAELQRLLKEKQEEKQRMHDNDKQREIDYLKRKLTTENINKVTYQTLRFFFTKSIYVRTQAWKKNNVEQTSCTKKRCGS